MTVINMKSMKVRLRHLYDVNLWLRMALIAVSLGIFYLIEHYFLWWAVVAHLLVLLCLGSMPDWLQSRTVMLSVYLSQLLDFLLGATDVLPYPFGSAPVKGWLKSLGLK